MGKDKKYIIVLFSNRKKRRVLFKSNNLNNTKKKYKEFLEKEKPLFPQVFRNKTKVNYEVAIVTTVNHNIPELFTKDDIGRINKAEFQSDVHYFLDIQPYEISEKLWDFQDDIYIDAETLYSKIKKGNLFKQVFTLNNKIFVQIDDKVKGYGLKNIEDCQRLFNILRNHSINESLGNIMYVQDISTAQRKDLYILLQKNGFPKESLYRHYSY